MACQKPTELCNSWYVVAGPCSLQGKPCVVHTWRLSAETQDARILFHSRQHSLGQMMQTQAPPQRSHEIFPRISPRGSLQASLQARGGKTHRWNAGVPLAARGQKRGVAAGFQWSLVGTDRNWPQRPFEPWDMTRYTLAGDNAHPETHSGEVRTLSWVM